MAEATDGEWGFFIDVNVKVCGLTGLGCHQQLQMKLAVLGVAAVLWLPLVEMSVAQM